MQLLVSASDGQAGRRPCSGTWRVQTDLVLLLSTETWLNMHTHVGTCLPTAGCSINWTLVTVTDPAITDQLAVETLNPGTET